MLDDPQAAIELWSHPGFQTGLVVGLVGLVLVLAVAEVLRLLRRRTFGWGVIFAFATVVALMMRADIELHILFHLAALASTGLLVDLTAALRWRRRWILITTAWVVVAAAAVWFGYGIGIVEPSWVIYGLPLTVIGLGAGLWVWGRLPEAGVVGPLAVISVAGAWVTIPEIDSFAVLVGVALPMGLGTLWPLNPRPCAAGALAVAGVFAWMVVQGGLSRPWTVAASWAAVAAIPVIAVLIHRGFGKPGRVLILVIHLLFVAVVTRVSDYSESASEVVVWSAAALVAAGLVVVLLPKHPLASTNPVDP